MRQAPRPMCSGLPAGRVVAALTGAGLVGTAMEAGLLHFRGAFHNPAMLLPVTAPPAAAAMLGAAAIGKADRPAARRAVAAIHRAHGRRRRRLPRDRSGAQHGWLANWTQNLSSGSAAAGSPSFTGLALAGLAALACAGQPA